MYQLYTILKNHPESPTKKDMDIASGRKVLEADAATAYLGHIEKASANILLMFAKQSQQDVVIIYL